MKSSNNHTCVKVWKYCIQHLFHGMSQSLLSLRGFPLCGCLRPSSEMTPAKENQIFFFSPSIMFLSVKQFCYFVPTASGITLRPLFPVNCCYSWCYGHLLHILLWIFHWYLCSFSLLFRTRQFKICNRVEHSKIVIK